MALLNRRLLLSAVAAGAVAVPAVWPAAAHDQAAAQQVRAAFLYHFTKFVEWPGPGPSPDEPFRVCIAADDVFTRAFDQIIAGESVHGRKLVRVDPDTAEAVRGCQILYFGLPEPDRASRLLAAVGRAPVLTVGEGPSFLKEGGAIQFVLEKNRVRFDVSLPAIERAELKVSSKLLRVARHVEAGSGK